METILLVYLVALVYTNSIAFICSALCKPIMNRDIAKLIEQRDLIINKGSLYESNSALKSALYFLIPGKNLKVLINEIKSHSDLDRLIDDMLVDGRLRRQGDDFYEEKEPQVVDSIYKKVLFEIPADKYKAVGNNLIDFYNKTIDPLTYTTVGEDETEELSPFSRTSDIEDIVTHETNTLGLRVSNGVKSETAEVTVDEEALLAKYIVKMDADRIGMLERELKKVKALKENDSDRFVA